MPEILEENLPIASELVNTYYVRGLDSDMQSILIPLPLLQNNNFSAIVDFQMFNLGTLAPGPTTVVPGTVLTFEERTLINRLVTIYRWAVLNGETEVTTSNLRNPSITFGVAGTFNVKLELYDSAGVLITSVRKDNLVVVSASTNTIQFHVHNSLTGVSISGAEISISGYTPVLTNASGNASITIVGTGTAVFTVRFAGYDDYQSNVVVPQTSPPKTINLVQTVVGYDLSFVVIGTNGLPMSGVLVSLTSFSPDIAGYTDALGMITFEGVPAGTYAYSITKAGYEPKTASIAVPPLESVEVQLSDSALTVPAYIGYRTPAQGATITENIVKGVTDPTQQALLADVLQMSNYPDRIKLYHSSRWVAMSGEGLYYHWVCIPNAWLKAYAFYKESIAMVVYPLTNFGTSYVVASITINGLPYTLYSVYNSPLNMYLGVTSSVL
jgi:hypothetical protein